MKSAHFNIRHLFSRHMKIGCLICLAVSMLIRDPSSVVCADNSKTTKVKARGVSDFRKDLKVFMKLSKSPDPQTERIAIYNLCQLHLEIAIAPRFDESLQLQGMRVVIAKRLATYSNDFENSLKRKARKEKKTAGNRKLDLVHAGDLKQLGNSKPEVPEVTERAAIKDDETSTSLTSLLKSSDEADLEKSMWNSAVTTYDSLNCVSGGPDRIFYLIGGHLAPPWDHGQDLVDLITTVIHPNSWRNNGGNASIHYYQPSRVLVIHASLQGHNETSNLLEKLRGSAPPQLNVSGGQGIIRN
jgi:hypothetical protein